MKTSTHTFPSCLSLWAKKHPTVELVDKCIYEIQFHESQTLPADIGNFPTKLEEWNIDHITTFFHGLSLSHDYSFKLQQNGVAGDVLALACEGKQVSFAEIGIEKIGDVARIKKALSEKKLI